MKKVVKLISLFILLLIVNVGVVRAANKCGNVTISTIRPKSNDDKLDYQLGSNNIFQYKFKIQSSTEVTATTATAYCHNPGIHDFNTGGTTMGCTSLLFDESGNNTFYDNVFGVGLMTILNANGTYAAKYIAENMYEMLFTFKDSKSYDTTQVKYLRYYLAAYYKDYKGELNSLLQSGLYGIANVDLNVKCPGSCTNDTTMQNAIKLLKKGLQAANLYNKGKTTKTPVAKVNNPAPVTVNSGDKRITTLTFEVNVENFPEYGTDKPSVKLKFTCDNCAQNNVNVRAKLQNTNMTLDELGNTNILEKYKDKNKIKLVVTFESDKSKCINLSYSLNAIYEYNTSSLVNDKDDLTDDEKNLVEEVLKALNNTGYEVGECTSREKCQGFYVLQNNEIHTGNNNNNNNNNSNNGGNSNVNVNRSNNVQKELTVKNTISTCNNSDDSSSNKSVCSPKVSNVSCTRCEEDTHTIEIKEGYKYTNDNVCDTSGETLNVADCIIDNKDIQNNTYKNTELSNISIIGGANVYCKEDFSLTLPGSKVTEPGRYFILDPTSIKGTKSCYSSKYNDTSTLEEKVKTAEQQMIDAYNSYLATSALWSCLKQGKEGNGCIFNKANGDGKWSIVENSCVISSHTEYEEVPTTCGQDCVAKAAQCGNSSKCKSSCSGSRESQGCFYTRPKNVENNGKKYDVGGTIVATYYPYSSSSCKESNTPSTNSVEVHFTTECMRPNDHTYDQYMTWSDEVNAKLKEEVGDASTLSCSPIDPSKPGGNKTCSGSIGTGLTGDVENAQAAIESEISTWNNAFKWEMDYSFNPAVHFWYQEDYVPNSNLLNLTAKTTTTYCNGYESDDHKKCYSDSNRTKEIGFSDKSLWYCNGEVSDDYTKCNNDAWSNVIPTDTVKYCSCDTSGCSTKTATVYNTKYVKQEQSKTNTYQAPNGFYSLNPGGNVVTGLPGRSDDIVNSIELNGVLPVSLNTIGTRRYSMWIESLGEYYDKNTDNLGRISGKSSSVLPKLLKNQENAKCNIPDAALVSKDNVSKVNFSGVYACKYTTDCPTENKCNWNNGNPICSDGEICTTDEYYKQCTSCGVNNPDLPPLIENEKYTYCDYLPLGSANATYQCRIKVDKTQYNNDCKPSLPTYYKCGNPQIKNNKYYYFADESLKIYRDGVSAEQYYKDCTSCGINKPELKPEIKNDLYYYYHQTFDYSKGMVGFKNGVDYNQYKTDCCPDCPPSINYSCAVPYEETINGEVKYTYRINGINKIRVSADERNKDCPPISCNKTTNEKGDTIYYGKDGQITDEKTYKTQCCPNGDCPITCTYCLYDGNKLNIQYRPITSEDLNPNNRELGINWQWDNNIDTTMELKAYVTTDEIEETGDEIFNLDNSDFNNKTDNNDSFAMKVTMDANLISKLRSINKNKKFMTNTLKCYDYKDENDNAIYENIYCYSTVIDDILNDPKTKNNIVFTVERPLESERDKNNVNEKYFTNFISKTATEWKLGTGISLAIADTAQNKYGIEIDRTTGKMTDYHVGPSWK